MATLISWSAAANHFVSVKMFHQHFKLHSVVRIFQIDSHSKSLLLPLESFIDIICKYGCAFPGAFSALYPSWFGGSMFLLSKSWASFLATIRSISFPVVFCIVRIWCQCSLIWTFPRFEIGLRQVCHQSSGMCPVANLSSYNVKTSLLFSTDMFLMSWVFHLVKTKSCILVLCD